MSRKGKKPVTVPDKVEVKFTKTEAAVKGPKGELKQTIPYGITFEEKDKEITVKRINETKKMKSLHGLMRSLLAGMIEGVSEGFEKQLEVIGVGYRVQKQGNGLKFKLGYSHEIDFPAPEGIELNVLENNVVSVKGIDKQAVGEAAAKIRRLRPPEPYKGKGIRLKGERVRKKVGKSGI